MTGQKFLVHGSNVLLDLLLFLLQGEKNLPRLFHFCTSDFT